MSFPTPEMTNVNRPYWEGLAEGELRYQHCVNCEAEWLPPRANCPSCLAADPGWRVSTGRGTVVSWIVYHKAYAEHLKDRLPYDVTIVALDEGPRLLSNVVDCDAGRRLFVGARLALVIEEEEGLHLPRFRLDPEAMQTHAGG